MTPDETPDSPPQVRAKPVPAPNRNDGLTWVELVFDKGRVERWIRFGAVLETRIVTRRNRFVAFPPGEVFAYVRWSAGDRGTILSRLDILIAPRRGEPLTSVPGVSPGGVSLLRLSGWPRVKAVLDAINAIEALDIAPEAVAPDHWRHVHNRLLVGETPRTYTRSRHEAWLLRRMIAS